MSTQDPRWFEIAVVSIVFALGHIFFGHFEERTGSARKFLKYVVTLVLILALSHYFGRTVAMTVLAAAFIPVIYVHAILLPRKGINGWTGEPREKYYEFRKWDKDISRSKTSGT